MKPVLRPLIAASLALAAPQFANACGSNIPLTKIDVAFADVIFEGRILDVRPDMTDRSSELLFDVVDVARGELAQKRVTVVLQGGVAYRAPQSVEEFAKRYGETTRIALTTPEQVEMFCRDVSAFSVTGSGERREDTFYRCDYASLSLSPKAKDKPFILRRTCGEPYLFETASFEKMTRYDANVEKFNRLPRSFQTPKAFRDMVGGGRLPWEYAHSGHSQTVAIELYRNYGYLFTSALKEDEAAQNMLLEKGVELIKNDKTFYPRSPAREKDIEYFRGQLQRELLQISSVVEEDPKFGNRLLRND